MCSILSAAIVFYISFAVGTTFGADDGYIIGELNLPCQDPTASVVSEKCSGFINYKIGDFSKTPFGSNVSAIFDAYRKRIDNVTRDIDFFENKQCSDAGRKYICEASYPLRCDNEYVKIDMTALGSTCLQAVEFCSRLDLDVTRTFNCSVWSHYGNSGIDLKLRRKFTCVDYPALNDDPFTCKTDYKVSLKHKRLS